MDSAHAISPKGKRYTMSESFTLRVRGEEIGRAFGLENWQRAASFVCDRFGRTATTPRWAFDASAEVLPVTAPTDVWAILSERPWRPSSADADRRDHHEGWVES
jgi:hypothetical protein